jgi:hypothetical protein
MNKSEDKIRKTFIDIKNNCENNCEEKIIILQKLIEEHNDYYGKIHYHWTDFSFDSKNKELKEKYVFSRFYYDNETRELIEKRPFV